MTRRIRWIVGVAALAMSAAYALPLWRIALIAPQYPEGLGLLIRVNAIDGFKEGDLQSINGLNHYIGMKVIEPDSIPELRLMPLILGVLIVTGVGVAVWGRRGPFLAWAVVLALVLLAGVGDFWKWGYKYGHDLSPTAIIKVPGMTYQPPLIGSKKLLNFTATSWPGYGGWILIVVAGAVAGAVVSTLRRGARTRHASAEIAVLAAAGVAVLAVAGCAAAGPRAIALHEDACAQCRMSIVDPRYGGEAITRNGRIYTFDSVECLVSWVRVAPAGTVARTYVLDVQHPGTFIAAESASYLRGVGLSSPMGRAIVALASAQAADAQKSILRGTRVSWQELLTDTAGAVKGGQ